MPPKTSQGRGDEDDEEYVNRGELYDGGNKDSLGAQHDSEEQSDPITRPRTIQNEADRIKYDEEEAYDGGNKDSDIRHDSEERSDRIDKSPQPRATHPYTGSIKKTRVGEDDNEQPYDGSNKDLETQRSTTTKSNTAVVKAELGRHHERQRRNQSSAPVRDGAVGPIPHTQKMPNHCGLDHYTRLVRRSTRVTIARVRGPANNIASTHFPVMG
ncbi:MAG: hypothetical protein M1813_006971 [Trichoglossum hirsutum]|nr:MAG: hypothetical protein M1813_006971 [Trichoglossum hirsutum]